MTGGERQLASIIVSIIDNYFFITKIRAESPTKIYKDQRSSLFRVGRMRWAH